MFGEQFQQAGIRRATVDDDSGPHAALDRVQRGFGFWNHPAGDHARSGHFADLMRLQLGQNLSGVRLRVAREYRGVNTNVLTDDEFVDPVSGNIALNGVPVTVAPAG